MITYCLRVTVEREANKERKGKESTVRKATKVRSGVNFIHKIYLTTEVTLLLFTEFISSNASSFKSYNGNIAK